MPKIEDRASALRRKSAPRIWRHRVVRPAVLAFAGSLWLGACAPTGKVAPAPLAVEPTAGPIVASPASLAGSNSQILREESSGPIALAPSMTGPPVRTPAPPPEPPRAAALPEPVPAPIAVAPEPAPAAAAASPPVAPSPCPPGQIATRSTPDMAGAPVLLCRRLYP